MTKVVINTDFGGFGLSDQAFELFLKKKGIEFERVQAKHFTNESEYYRKGHVGEEDHYLWHYDLCEDRSDKHLVEVVEELGDVANGSYASLKVVEIDDDLSADGWYIAEYDGREHVAERHRTWS